MAELTKRANMGAYATLDDMTIMWRAMSAEEQARAAELLPIVSDCLRAKAKNTGRDLDKMIMKEPHLASVAKSVTVDVTARILQTSTDQEPMTQMSQSAGGFSVSGTFLVPGGGIFIRNSELSSLGLKRPRYGARDFYGISD